MRIPGPRRNLLAAAAMAISAALLPLAVAHASSLARIDVYDRTAGTALPIYPHLGRKYVEGQPGNEYAVRIRNCSSQRMLAVVSVDGVNAVTGETAAPDQSGYVIEPGGYVTVQGWRKDLNRTAAFYFSDPEASYAARTGRPDDLGVIGVALFREREPVRQGWWSGERGSAGAPAAKAEADSTAKRTVDGRAANESAAAPAARQPSLGTGHGRGEYSPVQQVAFQRASATPDEVVAIRYERREALVAMGVLPPQDRVLREPDPFPATLSFVPDP